MNTNPLVRNARLLVLAGFFSTVALQADEPKSEVGRREQRQQDRIANGIDDGQLTPAEVARLEKHQAELQDQIKNDRSANGGHLTPVERRQINAELDVTSRRIYRAKHNDKTVPPAKP